MPNLSGFIEAFNPFRSGRFFDTPPEYSNVPDSSDRTDSGGFTLKPDVSVAGLNVNDSQMLMTCFDQVIILLYFTLPNIDSFKVIVFNCN